MYKSWIRQRQAYTRAFVMRSIRDKKAAIKIQSQVRGNAARQRVQRLIMQKNRIEAAVKIQCCWRSAIAKKILDTLRNEWIKIVKAVS